MQEQLSRILTKIEETGGDARPLIFEPPAQSDDVYEIEQQLKYRIPNDFKNALLTVSAHCEFSWFLPDNLELSPELRGIFGGNLHWGLNLILDFNQSKDSWIKEVFPDVNNEYDKVWHNKFVFYEVRNGDFISIELDPANYGKIIYLSHDDGDGHGYVMANSFTELLKNWTQLGCTGGEDWQWLPFCHDKTSGIDPHCSKALLWRRVIGLI